MKEITSKYPLSNQTSIYNLRILNFRLQRYCDQKQIWSVHLQIAFDLATRRLNSRNIMPLVSRRWQKNPCQIGHSNQSFQKEVNILYDSQSVKCHHR